MFKLVAVGGQIRGQEFELKEGENIVGRASESDVVLTIDGVSKRHMKISVSGDSAYIEDLGSSNGTFINGKTITKQSIQNGDKIALPNVILQILHVQERKVIVKKQVSKVAQGQEGDAVDFDDEQAPSTLIGRVIFWFKKKPMMIVHGFNEQYEWGSLFAIVLFIFIFVNISLTIYPVIRESRHLLVDEIKLRGEQYAVEVARANSAALGRRDLDKVDTNFLDNAEGVRGYELFDIEGRIVRPLGKLNTYSSDPFSVEAQNFYKDPKNIPQTLKKELSATEIGIAVAIRAYDIKLGREEAVGIIAIRFAPKAMQIEAKKASGAFLETLSTSGFVAIVFFGIIYFMTIRHLDEMKYQIENVLRGKQKELHSKLQFRELNSLRSTINSILQRLKEFQNVDASDMSESEDDAPYVRTLQEFMQGSQGPVMILDSNKSIQFLNPEAEDLLGIRENASQGQSLLDSARDQGIAATIIDLCDKSAGNGGVNQHEGYDIQGGDHTINVCSLIGKDKFAKAFYITFVKAG
jgi:PAS domain-containing protein